MPLRLPLQGLPLPLLSPLLFGVPQFQQEQQRTRSEFAAKSRAHAETIASLRQGHSDAAKTMEAESRAKLREHEAEQQERQREAEERRKEPLSTGGLCATAGSVAQLTAEVRALPSRRLRPFQLLIERLSAP